MKLLSILTVGVALTSAAFAADATPETPSKRSAHVVPSAPHAKKPMPRFGEAINEGSPARCLNGAFDNAADAREITRRLSRLRIGH